LEKRNEPQDPEAASRLEPATPQSQAGEPIGKNLHDSPPKV
jgi:hypothetical protein